MSRTINAAQDDTATVFHGVDWIEKPGYSATLREASVQSVTPTQVNVTIGGGSYSFNNTIRHRPDIRLEAASTGAPVPCLPHSKLPAASWSPLPSGM